jgi:hypothetical protein
MPPPSARCACSHLPRWRGGGAQKRGGGAGKRGGGARGRGSGAEGGAGAHLGRSSPTRERGGGARVFEGGGGGALAQCGARADVARGQQDRPPSSARCACSHLPRWRGGGAPRRGVRSAEARTEERGSEVEVRGRSSPTRERGGGARVFEGGGGGALAQCGARAEVARGQQDRPPPSACCARSHLPRWRGGGARKRRGGAPRRGKGVGEERGGAGVARGWSGGAPGKILPHARAWGRCPSL